MKRKVGIFTLQLYGNYGGILQCYALQTVLRRLDYDVVVMKARAGLGRPLRVRWKCYLRRLLRTVVLTVKRVFGHERVDDRFQRNTLQFVKTHICCKDVDSPYYFKTNKFDALVVGSDQIWRKEYWSEMDQAFFDFAKSWKHVRRLSYAASFGVNTWQFDPAETERLANLIRLFDGVSVRERSAVGLCRKYLHVDAEWVVDPTLLLSRGDYVALVRGSDVPARTLGGLFCYMLDDSDLVRAVVSAVAAEREIEPFFIHPRVWDSTASPRERMLPTVEQWIDSFVKSDFVVTDSFHGCVFSIIFGKPFVVVGNHERGYTRFESLLSMFGLERRMVDSVDGLRQVGEIDWNDVSRRLQDARKRSMSFLCRGLGVCAAGKEAGVGGESDG